MFGVSRPRLVVISDHAAHGVRTHSMLWLPRKISIRSILSVVKFAKSYAAVVALFMIAPSIKNKRLLRRSAHPHVNQRAWASALIYCRVPGPSEGPRRTVFTFRCCICSPVIISTALVT